MKSLKSLFVLGFMCIGVISCGSSSSSDPKPDSYYDLSECDRRYDRYGVGVRGNSACPYAGQYDDTRGYEQYSVSYDSQLDFNLGIGYKIDFGWDNDWENVCPVPGQIPVFVNGRFNHCDMANPSYAEIYDGTNTSSCAGSQYSPTLTSCTPYGINPTGDDGVRYVY